MPLQLTAAPSARINKPAASARRKSSLPSLSRRGTPQKSKGKEKKLLQALEHDAAIPSTGNLETVAIMRIRLAPDLCYDGGLVPVEQVMTYLHQQMFSPVPSRASGIKSTRVADILNYRRRLPRLVPMSSLYALATSRTAVDREIATKLHSGTLRKVVIPRRSTGTVVLGEAVALIAPWEELVNQHPDLTTELKAKYVQCLKNHLLPLNFTPAEVDVLVSNSLLTASAVANERSSLSAAPTTASIGSLVSLAAASRLISPDRGSQSVSSARAVQSLRSQPEAPTAPSSAPYLLSIPNTGSFLKLVGSARIRLRQLLIQFGGSYNALPLDFLRERWNGGSTEVGDVLTNPDDIPVLLRQSRVLPGQTKKWREHWGLKFEWVLAEALGAGMVECFATGSVGTGVRLT